jgi:hypothetical protein
MNMKRGLVFTLCALAAVATATVGQAQTIDLSLNLRYNDPFDPTEGGVWYLTARTQGGTPNAGIAGVSAYLSNINPVAFHGSSVPLGTGQNVLHGAYPAVGQATINNLSSGANPYNGPVGGAHNVVYGQDIAVGAPSAIIGSIGQGGTSAGNVANDPLKNTAFNNYAVLLSGTFGGTRPAFAALSGGTITDGNVLANTTLGTAAIDAAIAAGNLKVRGDSEVSKGLNTPGNAGLFQGDANRDGSVTGADFNILAFNFGDPAPVGGFTWDQGDFNDDGIVSGADFNALAFNFGDPSPPPPAVSSVPEPTSLALVGLGALSFLGIRRRVR